METSATIRLDLRAPLEYAEAPGLTPFGGMFPEGNASRETLFCFELDGEQAGRFEPEADCFLGKLVFAGIKGSGQKKVLLQTGPYLFTQQRKTLNREECIYLAIDQQKDGLWEKLKLGSRLYIRFLTEDDRAVTQLFRSYSSMYKEN